MPRSPARAEPADTPAATGGEATRERILVAATDLIMTQGYAATSISQIAKASSAHPASLYWAFKSKEGLLAAVIDRASEAYYRIVLESVADHPDLSDGIKALARPFRKGESFTRLLMMLTLERRDGDPEVTAAARRARGVALDLLERKLSELPELERAPSEDMGRRLARHLLMQFDGLFIARQIEPDEIDLDDALATIAFGLAAMIRAIDDGGRP